jgi:hypothetical protein
MKRLSELAIKECVVELRAACRLPIDEPALATVVGWLRSNFQQILDHPDGAKRWADHGHRMRDNARHLGAFADFFASHNDTSRIGIEELTRGFELVKADCTVRADVPVAFQYCPEAPVNVTAAETFLRAVAPAPELV